MKTSKYILISFFVFIFGAIFVLYADAKAYGKSDNAFKPFNGSKNLIQFSVIVAETDANIEIINDSINTLSARVYTKDSLFKLPEYKIINDTLFIAKNDNATLSTAIITCKSVKSIIGNKGSKIQINKFKSDSLLIRLTNSNVYGSLSEELISFVEIIAHNKSNINIQESNINSILIKADNSKIQHFGKAKTINSILTNNSNLFTRKSRKLTIDTDTSSTYSISSN